MLCGPSAAEAVSASSPWQRGVRQLGGDAEDTILPSQHDHYFDNVANSLVMEKTYIGLPTGRQTYGR